MATYELNSIKTVTDLYTHSLTGKASKLFAELLKEFSKLKSKSPDFLKINWAKYYIKASAIKWLI